MRAKDYFITITIEDSNLPLDQLVFRFYAAVGQDPTVKDTINQHVNVAIWESQEMLKKLNIKNIEITKDMIEVETVE